MLYIWIVSTILFPNYLYILHMWYFEQHQCRFTFWRGELYNKYDVNNCISYFYVHECPMCLNFAQIYSPEAYIEFLCFMTGREKVIKTCTNWIELATHWEYQGLNARLIDLRILLSSLVTLGNTSKEREICRTNFLQDRGKIV